MTAPQSQSSLKKRLTQAAATAVEMLAPINGGIIARRIAPPQAVQKSHPTFKKSYSAKSFYFFNLLSIKLKSSRPQT